MTTPELPYYPITHDDGLNIVEALNDLIGTENSLSLIAEDFDETKSYEVGNYVRYSTLLYRFTTPHPAGVWNENHVTPIKVGEQLNAFNNEKINNNAVAPEFRNDVNYAVGDVVSYQGGLYRYLSPHIAGNWDRTEVVATNAISEGSGSGGGTGVGDEITFDGDNMIITSSERSIESLESSIAIVANGNTHPLINQGEYVYVKMHDTLPEGLYTANSTIVETDNLTTSNLSSVSKGGLNKLNENTIKDVSYGFSSSSYSDLQSKLITLANDMLNGESKLIRFYIDFDSSVFARGSTCFGNLNIISKATSYLYFSCLVSDNICNVICISYNNGTWFCKKLASTNYCF